MRGCGCVGTRHSPRPSQVNGGKFLHNSGAFAPRERGHSRPPLRHRPRRRAIQYCRGADDQSTGRGVLDTRFRGYDDWAGLQKRPFANASAGECHSPCHRPRRRAIQYCRGADDQSRGRGVLDTRFRGYDDWAGLHKAAVCACERGRMSLAVIAREGGRSSIAEELMINREAAAYWIPAFAGMTAGRGCKSGRLRMRAQANVTLRVIAREGGRSRIAEEPMINRQAAAYWIPAFAGMTAGPTTNATCLRLRARANVTRRVIAREGGRSSIAEELMINREAAAYWIPAFAGMTAGAYDKHRLFAHGSGAGEWHSPCHRPRRRAIQYCRGADDQSRGRGVLDTRFRGYDDLAGLQKRPFAHASAGECHVPSSPAKAGDPVLQRS